MNDYERAELCRKLADLLEDEDGRGMASWQMARRLIGSQLHTALSEALGLDDEYMRGYSDGYEAASDDGGDL